MDQLSRLLLDGRHHLGMAMAGGGHGDAGGEVEELVAVHVFDAHAAAALGYQRIGAGVGRRNVTVIALQVRAGIGAG